MDGRTHTAIKLHTCGSCIKQFIYYAMLACMAGSVGGHIRVLEKSVSPVTRQRLNVCMRNLIKNNIYHAVQ